MCVRISRERTARVIASFATMTLATIGALFGGTTVHAQSGGPFGVDLDRRYDQNSFLATHDSFANIEEGYSPPTANHGSSITHQLDKGVRVISLRGYLMKQWNNGFNYLFRFLEGENWNNNFGKPSPPDDIQPDVYNAHSPEFGYVNVPIYLGWKRFSASLQEIALWLDNHPDQVVTLSISDRTESDNQRTLNLLRNSRLGSRLFFADYPNPGFNAAASLPWEVSKHGWPTLRQLLSQGRNVVITYDGGPEEPANNCGALNSDNLYERMCWRSRRNASGEATDHADDNPPAVNWDKKLFSLGLKPYLILAGHDWPGPNLPLTGSPNFGILNNQENLIRKISLLRFHNAGRIPNWLSLDGVDFGDNEGPAAATRYMNRLWARQALTTIPPLRPSWERSKVWRSNTEKYFTLGYDARVAKLGNYLFAGCNGRLVQFDAITGEFVAEYGDLAIASLKDGEVHLATQANLPYLFVSNRRWVYRFDLGSDGRLHKVWEHELSLQIGQYQITRATMIPFNAYVYVGYSGICYRLRKSDGSESDVNHLNGGGWGPVEMALSPLTNTLYAGAGGQVFKINALANDFEAGTQSVELEGRGGGDTVTLTTYYDQSLRRDQVFAGCNSGVFKIFPVTTGIAAIGYADLPGNGAVSLANDGASTFFAGSGGAVAAITVTGQIRWLTDLPKGTGRENVNIGFVRPQFATPRLIAGCNSYLFDMDVQDGFVSNTVPLQDGSYQQDDSYNDTVGVVRTWGSWPGYNPNDVFLSFGTRADGGPMVFAGVNGMTFGMHLDFDDPVPPVTTPSLPAPNGYNGWYKTSVRVTLNANDGTSGVPASNPLRTFYKLDGGTERQYTTPFLVSGEGLHTVRYFSLDNRNNAEEIKYLSVRIDSTPPVTQIRVSPVAGSTSQRVQLPATDNVSGVLHTFYRINDGDWVDELGLGNPGFTLAPGTYKLDVYSQDDAGNNESMQTQTISFGPLDVTPLVQVTRGSLRYDRATLLWKQDIALTNTSGKLLNGPLTMVVAGLPTGVTLENKTGVTAAISPAGKPYLNIPDLAAGETKQVTLVFRKANASSAINYTLSFYAYPGNR